jgi:hypothetical protein
MLKSSAMRVFALLFCISLAILVPNLSISALAQGKSSWFLLNSWGSPGHSPRPRTPPTSPLLSPSLSPFPHFPSSVQMILAPIISLEIYALSAQMTRAAKPPGAPMRLATIAPFTPITLLSSRTAASSTIPFSVNLLTHPPY